MLISRVFFKYTRCTLNLVFTAFWNDFIIVNPRKSYTHQTTFAWDSSQFFCVFKILLTVAQGSFTWSFFFHKWSKLELIKGLMTLCILHWDYLTSPVTLLLFHLWVLVQVLFILIIYRNCVNIEPIIDFRFQALFVSPLLHPGNSVYLLILTH